MHRMVPTQRNTSDPRWLWIRQCFRKNILAQILHRNHAISETQHIQRYSRSAIRYETGARFSFSQGLGSVTSDGKVACAGLIVWYKEYLVKGSMPSLNSGMLSVCLRLSVCLSERGRHSENLWELVRVAVWKWWRKRVKLIPQSKRFYQTILQRWFKLARALT